MTGEGENIAVCCNLKWRQVRKGVADLHGRAEVSQKADERLVKALASVDDSQSLKRFRNPPNIKVGECAPCVLGVRINPVDRR